MNLQSYIKNNPNKAILYFLAGLTIINLLQSIFTDLIFDEAYYWYFAKDLDWGYFDHPPMVAFFIKLSGFVFSNEIGVRFFAPFLFTGTIYITWLLIDHPKKNDHILLFCTLVFALPLLSAYGFFMLPDTPLIFFAALFLYTYKQFLDSNSWKWTLLLGFCLAALMYSKYHAILLIFGILISNPKILLNPRFWIATAISLILFTPHLLWLADTNFSTLEYHLIERAKTNFKFGRIAEYLGGQLGVRGLIFFFCFWALFKYKTKDIFQKGCKIIVFTVLIFFLFSSFKRNTQPQWTIAAMVPFIIISYYYLIEKISWHKWFYRLAIVNIIIIAFVRIALVEERLLPFNYEAHGNKEWVKTLYEKSNGLPAVFENSYRDASMYAFYSGVETYSANNLYYRKSQYDLDSTEMKMQGKKVVFATKWGDRADFTFNTKYKKQRYKGYVIDNFRSYRKLKCIIPTEELILQKDSLIPLEIQNPYNYPVDLAKNIVFFGAYTYENNDLAEEFIFKPEELSQGKSLILEANQSITLHFKLSSLPKKDNIKFFRVALSEFGLTLGFQGERIAIKRP